MQSGYMRVVKRKVSCFMTYIQCNRELSVTVTVTVVDFRSIELELGRERDRNEIKVHTTSNI